MPFAGGLYDQPAIWLQAIEAFKRGPGLYKDAATKVSNTISDLMKKAKETK